MKYDEAHIEEFLEVLYPDLAKSRERSTFYFNGKIFVPEEVPLDKKDADKHNVCKYNS
jgi:hypothetical protein